MTKWLKITKNDKMIKVQDDKNDKKWHEMTRKDKKWQKGQKNDKEWQRITKKDKKWQK